MELDLVNISHSDGTVLSFVSRRIGGTLEEEGVCLPGTSMLLLQASTTRSFYGTQLMQCTVASSTGNLPKGRYPLEELHRVVLVL